MTLVGLIALSVETKTNVATAASADNSANRRVPSTLLLNASAGWRSIMNTCLWAAA